MPGRYARGGSPIHTSMVRGQWRTMPDAFDGFTWAFLGVMHCGSAHYLRCVRLRQARKRRAGTLFGEVLFLRCVAISRKRMLV